MNAANVDGHFAVNEHANTLLPLDIFMLRSMVFCFFCLVGTCLQGSDVADLWIATRAQYSSFVAEGKFVTHNQIDGGELKSFNGTFTWACDGRRFFCDIRMGAQESSGFSRYTCLRDHEQMAICMFSERMSSGCDIKIFRHDSNAYKNTFAFFPIDLHTGPEAFFPSSLQGALSGFLISQEKIAGQYEVGPIHNVFELNPKAGHLLSSLKSSVNGTVYTNQTWDFEVNADGLAVPRRLHRVSGTPGSGGFTDREVVFSSFSFGTTGFSFVFAELDACESARIIDQSGGGGVKYTRVLQSPTANASIRTIVETNKRITDARQKRPIDQNSKFRFGLISAAASAVLLLLAVVVTMRKKLST